MHITQYPNPILRTVLLQRTEHAHSFAIIKFADDNRLQFAVLSVKTGTHKTNSNIFLTIQTT